MNITEKDKQKARDYERQLEVMQTQMKNMRVWFSTLVSSTEPGEVEPESIDLGVNNPEKRPEWWRELDEGEVIKSGDVYKSFRRPGYTLCGGTVGDHYTPTPNSSGGWHEAHYRLRPWRDMEEGEVIQEGDQWLIGGEAWVLSRDAGVRVGEHLHGNRYRTRRPKPEKVEERPEVLPCRHCGGEAKLNSADDFWACSNIDCRQCGPSDDKGAIGWNEQNRKEEE